MLSGGMVEQFDATAEPGPFYVDGPSTCTDNGDELGVSTAGVGALVMDERGTAGQAVSR